MSSQVMAAYLWRRHHLAKAHRSARRFLQALFGVAAGKRGIQHVLKIAVRQLPDRLSTDDRFNAIGQRLSMGLNCSGWW